MGKKKFDTDWRLMPKDVQGKPHCFQTTISTHKHKDEEKNMEDT